MTGRSGTRSRSHLTPRSMRGIRSPATTRTSKRGRAPADGRSQPRVNSRCRSESIQSSTSVLVLLAVFSAPLQLLDEWVIVRQLLDAERKLHIGRTAIRTFEPAVVDESPFLAAGAAAKLGHGAILLRRGSKDRFQRNCPSPGRSVGV